MVTVGFIVEGSSDKKLIESDSFIQWLEEDCNLKIVNPVVDAGGNGQMCSRNIGVLVKALKKEANPDKIIVLADLDPDECAPCITKRKEIIGHNGIDLIVIAKKAIESWFLADTIAMRNWTGDNKFYEKEPETMQQMPWDRLKEIGKSTGRGPGATKTIFAKKIIKKHNFDIRQAAIHPDCPSAKYFVTQLSLLGTEKS